MWCPSSTKPSRWFILLGPALLAAMPIVPSRGLGGVAWMGSSNLGAATTGLLFSSDEANWPPEESTASTTDGTPSILESESISFEMEQPDWIGSLEDAVSRSTTARQKVVGQDFGASATTASTNCSTALNQLILHELDTLHVKAEQLAVEVRAQTVVLESARENLGTLGEALKVEAEKYEEDKRRYARLLLEAKHEERLLSEQLEFLRGMPQDPSLQGLCPPAAAENNNATGVAQERFAEAYTLSSQLQTLAQDRSLSELWDKTAKARFAARTVGTSSETEALRHKIDNATERLVHVCLAISSTRRAMQAGIGSLLAAGDRVPQECATTALTFKPDSLAATYHSAVAEVVEATAKCPLLQTLCVQEAGAAAVPTTTTSAPMALTSPPEAAVAPPHTSSPSANRTVVPVQPSGIVAPGEDVTVPPKPVCFDVDVTKPFVPKTVSPECGSEVSLEGLDEWQIVFPNSVSSIRPGPREQSENVTEAKRGGAPWFAMIDKHSVHLAPYPLLGTHWRHGVQYELKVAASLLWDECGRPNAEVSCVITTARDPAAAAAEPDTTQQVVVAWDGKGLRENEKKAVGA